MRTGERRQTPRLSVERPCKVQRQSGARCEPGCTLNVSTGGALLEVHSARPIASGERLAVAVAWDQGPLVQRQSMVPSRVVRTTTAGPNRQLIGVRFVVPQTLAVAA